MPMFGNDEERNCESKFEIPIGKHSEPIEYKNLSKKKLKSYVPRVEEGEKLVEKKLTWVEAYEDMHPSSKEVPAPKIRKELVESALLPSPRERARQELGQPKRPRYVDPTDPELKEMCREERLAVVATGEPIEKIRAARAQLEKEPDDPTANLIAEAERELIEEMTKGLIKEPGAAPVHRMTGDSDFDSLIAEVILTIGSKGEEYTVGSPDRLANFRRAAKKCSRRGRAPLHMTDVWTIFFDKHMSAIESYLENDFRVKSNEPIRGRIMDAIVYLVLLYKMTVEIERERATDEREKFEARKLLDDMRTGRV